MLVNVKFQQKLAVFESSWLVRITLLGQNYVLRQAGYDHGHNILRLFDVSPNFPFTRSETMLHY